MKFNRLEIANYRCFSDVPQGFSDWRGINLIIGRNNSGKSRLLDLVKHACGGAPAALADSAYILVGGELEQADLQMHFPANSGGGDVPGNHWDFAIQFIGS